eukprot:956058-Pelagomonas_calceolata.AAC.1
MPLPQLLPVQLEHFTKFEDAIFIPEKTTAPNHPQVDGLAKRAVQSFKRALHKICEASAAPPLWDMFLPWILLGCNCSTQASTKMSPYFMLYARHPVIPPAHVYRFANDLDLHDLVNASRTVLARAQTAQNRHYCWQESEDCPALRYFEICHHQGLRISAFQ